MPGSLQNENGFSKKSSTLPSVASDFGEKIKPFPNSEVLASVHNITGNFFTCPLASIEILIGLYLKNSFKINLWFEKI